MNVLDILLLAGAVWFAVIGYRQGFVVGILSVIGFLGGGLVAVYLLPILWDQLTDGSEVSSTAAVVAVVIVIVCASVGQAFTTHLGNKLRRYITWSPARALDATGGALVNVVAMLLVAWLIGSALAGTTLPTLGKEVRSSSVLLGISRVMPTQASTWFTDFSSVLAQNGFPQVFSPFANEPITEVKAPDPALVGSPVAARAKKSIVKVVGTAPGCGKVLEGTGFVFSDRRVMTNAHVVGGVDEPTVQIGGQGRVYDAKVVLYDWRRDIAVLDVPDLDAKPLRFMRPRQRRPDGEQRHCRGVPGERLVRRTGGAGPGPYQRGRPGHLPPGHRPPRCVLALRDGPPGQLRRTAADPGGRGVRRGVRQVARRPRHRLRADGRRDPPGHRARPCCQPAGRQPGVRALSAR